ncbi:hypothetical protein C4J81_19190 (plasmid) [Deltaproteobacteria bacterium Smac51]|nr:hypothetical protein C4J81_19190 [Deltaproteobacteria bacterium Smac51]
MESIDEVFRISLKICLKPWGAKSRLARDAGISSSYVWKLLNGSKYGTDETRRKIAAALGFPGAQYEKFLDLGRYELGLLNERMFESTHSEADKWKKKYYAKVEEFQAATTALLKALADAQDRITSLEEKGRGGSGSESYTSRKKFTP